MTDQPSRPFFHDGMRDLQDKYDGRRTADAITEKRVHDDFWDSERELIETAPMFFIATSYDDYTDCSIKAGDPGFVKIVEPGVLEYPEYDGNSMYRTLGNIAKNPNVGLLFVRFDGKSLKMRVNGKASLHDDPETLARHFGAKLVVRIACEIYPNCPRYAPNFEESKPSPYVPREGEGTPPAPEWKMRPYIQGILPEDDPHKE